MSPRLEVADELLVVVDAGRGRVGTRGRKAGSDEWRTKNWYDQVGVPPCFLGKSAKGVGETGDKCATENEGVRK